jgi:serine/threonine-protein kinase RsbW
MAEIPNVCLSLPSKPQNVMVVRQALTGVSELLALDAVEANDLNTAVTEACNNVVQHAYEGEEGPMEVEVYVLCDAIAVVVRDHGVGMPSHDRKSGHEDEEEDEDEDEHLDVERSAGIGLPVIGALSSEVHFTAPARGGTEVRMELAASAAAPLAPLAGGERRSLAAARDEPSDTIDLSVAPTALARAVLPRVLSALAARAHFSTDRISDVQLVADALATNAGDSIAGTHLDVGVTVAPRNLELRVGPLHSGRGESLVTAAADGLAPVVERLTDDAKSVPSAGDDTAEVLELRLVDQR